MSTNLQQNKKKRKYSNNTRLMLDTLKISYLCTGCKNRTCTNLRNLFQHINECTTTDKCKQCIRYYTIITLHSQECNSERCEFAYCRLLKQQNSVQEQLVLNLPIDEAAQLLLELSNTIQNDETIKFDKINKPVMLADEAANILLELSKI